ncbi:MAG TPA: laccase domain-containing protein, partial [Prolixibacteraceae bacterium]|nr:laccase domain-containing protein [Prolixibacteraceae bacterium]
MPDHIHLKWYKIFQQFNNIIAFTTTKQSLQTSLPRFTGDKETIFGENRNQLARLLRINENQLFFPRQTHSNCVAEIHNPIQSGLQNIDALVTNEKATCLCVQTADCVPILLFDPVKNVIAAVHAGWRGTVSL